jgi:hypothetical protein
MVFINAFIHAATPSNKRTVVGFLEPTYSSIEQTSKERRDNFHRAGG